MSHDGFSLYKGVKHVCYTEIPILNYTLNQFIQFFIRATFLHKRRREQFPVGLDCVGCGVVIGFRALQTLVHPHVIDVIPEYRVI